MIMKLYKSINNYLKYRKINRYVFLDTSKIPNEVQTIAGKNKIFVPHFFFVQNWNNYHEEGEM